MDINHLSSDILNAKAATLVAAICAQGNPVFHGRRAVAYDAARLGCANAADVEALEATAEAGQAARLAQTMAPQVRARKA